MKSSKHSLLNRKTSLRKSVVTNKKKICPGCGRKTIMRLGYCRFCTSSMNHW